MDQVHASRLGDAHLLGYRAVDLLSSSFYERNADNIMIAILVGFGGWLLNQSLKIMPLIRLNWRKPFILIGKLYVFTKTSYESDRALYLNDPEFRQVLRDNVTYRFRYALMFYVFTLMYMIILSSPAAESHAHRSKMLFFLFCGLVIASFSALGWFVSSLRLQLFNLHLKKIIQHR